MNTNSLGQTLFGILILALGVGFLLDAFNVADFSALLSTWWPLIVVGVGIGSLISNPRVFIWPLVIIALGLMLLARQLGWVDFSVWALIWPSIAIFIGLSLIFNIGHQGSTREINGDDLDSFVAFSGAKARSASQKFTGGKVTALFGGIELDLTDAKAKDQAVIDLFVAFGGIDIKVPEGWSVTLKGLPLFGGWEDKTKQPKNENAPKLVINGTCLFGGVTVKN